MKTGEEITEEIIEMLLLLGNTKDEVANNLHKRGIKGKRRICRSCPIAEYLGYKDTGIQVGYDFDYRLWIYRIDNSLSKLYFSQFAHIVDFIIDFDMGKYPFLIDCRS